MNRTPLRGRLLTIMTLLALALWALPAPRARAASFTVTNLNDTGAGSLRQAMLDANATAGADTVTFAVPGTITLESMLPAISDVAGLTIDGGGAITISGNNAVRVLEVNTNAALVVQNLTITSGRGYGAAIYNDDGGTVTVMSSTLSGNTGGYGAAIYNDDGGTVTVMNSTLSSNTGSRGGGIYNDQGGTVTVTNSTISGNSVDAGGAAIFNTYNSTATVTNSILSDNSGAHGGAIYNTTSTVTVTNSILSNNSATGTAGGIFNSNRGTVIVTSSTFSGNSATGNAGGIYAGIHGTVTITSSTFSDNSAGNGGGISAEFSSVTITSSTFSGNSAGTNGGGIFNNRDGTVTITSSTFSGNSAGANGGGTFNNDTGATTLQNSIIANNTSGNCRGNVTDGGGNLSYGDTSCPGLKADPMLGPLQNNGGPTRTVALLPGSPAIDAAPAATCPSTDQRGVVRPQDGNRDGTATCDIGAYEREPDRVSYQFRGFLQPVDNAPTVNVVAAGRAIPVKFSLTGNQGVNIFATGYPVSRVVNCDGSASVDPIEETVTAGSSSLTYDAGSDTYTYVWKTDKAWVGSCRHLTVRLNDGTDHLALFRFK
jgi:hypothetical protein